MVFRDEVWEKEKFKYSFSYILKYKRLWCILGTGVFKKEKKLKRMTSVGLEKPSKSFRNNLKGKYKFLL